MPGGAETADQSGASLAAGDFDGNGRDDLAIGVPYEDLGEKDSGAVNVLLRRHAAAGSLAREDDGPADILPM